MKIFGLILQLLSVIWMWSILYHFLDLHFFGEWYSLALFFTIAITVISMIFRVISEIDKEIKND